MYLPLTAQCHEHVRLTVNVTITVVLHRKMHFKKTQHILVTTVYVMVPIFF